MASNTEHAADARAAQKTRKPFGLWPSPITPGSLAQSLRLSDVAWDTSAGPGVETLVWLEGRSDRGVLVCAAGDQAPRDLTDTLSVRARVGYGGGDFGVGGGTVYFVAQEGRLYRQPLAGGQAQPITPSFGHMAAPTPSPDGRWVLYVYTHEGEDGLAVVDAQGQHWPQKLVGGEDFYMQPCWHPTAGGHGPHARIAWVSWNHPHMPWDATMLKMATLEAGGPGLPAVVEVETLVDRPDVAVFQPQFSPDGRWLAYISDEGGWGNLHLVDLETGAQRQLTGEGSAEIGQPAWAQGLRSYAFTPDGQCIVYVRSEAGFHRLWVVDVRTGETQALESPLERYTELRQIAIAPHSGTLAVLASSSTTSERLVTCALDTETSRVRVADHVRARSTGETVPAADLATPQAVRWAAPGTGAPAPGVAVHGLYYAPASSRFAGSGLPPAVINVHGGPTGQARAGYNPRAQFFATRGYAYLEVNYRGSTGYGKPYMAALRGQWGILDAEDAIGGARHLVDAGLADPRRLVIMGGSAGGYTVLRVMTLADHPFCAGICLYGISNLFTLAADTHKFEERYLDSMLGPLPEAADVYRERSPIYHAERIVKPIAIFQGEIDRVVPKDQAETIVESLRRRGVPHEYTVYEGEGHGWRKRETIEAFYRSVEAFLKQYVIFA